MAENKKTLKEILNKIPESKRQTLFDRKTLDSIKKYHKMERRKFKRR